MAVNHLSELGVRRLPSATVKHEESGQTCEDWGDTFPQAIASALLNLRLSLGMEDDR